MKKKQIVLSAIIAAIYTVLAIAFAPINFNMIQVRIPEALCILPIFTPYAIWGLFIGCLISNIIGSMGIIDIIFGSLATLISAYLSYSLRKKPLLAILPPVLINAFIVGFYLHLLYFNEINVIFVFAWVGLGQLIACYGLGYPLYLILKRYNLFKN